MFDIGFTEMMIIAVVALVVIGPERLPKVARQAGEWLGKLRRYVDDVKSDINRQMQLDELRKLQAEVKDAAQSIQSSVESAVKDTQNELNSLNAAFEGAASTTSDEPRTDWDRIYAVRRSRERLKDRRVERSKDLGLKRPKRAYPRFTRPVIEPEATPSPASTAPAQSPADVSVLANNPSSTTPAFVTDSGSATPAYVTNAIASGAPQS